MNENTKKIFLGIFILSCLAIALIVFLNKPSSKKSTEAYSYSVSANKVLLSDASGNMSTYNTNNGTLLMTDNTGAMKSLPFPKGMIMMWNGSVTDIPAGWVVCDGTATYVDISGSTKTVPDLSGRFALGAGAGASLTTRTPGDKAGVETVALTIAQMPSHSHGIPNIYGSGQQDRSSGDFNWFVLDGYAHPLSPYSTGSTGGSGTNAATTPHENMPPYYTLIYICYTGVGLV